MIVAAVNWTAPCPVLMTAKLCGGAGPPLTTAVKVRPVCDKRIDCPEALTVMVIRIGRVVAPSASATETDPTYVPGFSPAGFAVTVSETGDAPVALPCDGETESQAPPVMVFDVTVKSTVPPPLFETCTRLFAGGPPRTKAYCRPVASRASNGGRAG